MLEHEKEDIQKVLCNSIRNSKRLKATQISINKKINCVAKEHYAAVRGGKPETIATGTTVLPRGAPELSSEEWPRTRGSKVARNKKC